LKGNPISKFGNVWFDLWLIAENKNDKKETVQNSIIE